MMDPRHALALMHTPRLGRASLEALLERFGTPAGIFSAKPAELRTLPLAEDALAWLSAPDWRRIERDARWLDEHGVRLLPRGEPPYPPRLAALADAPLALFVRGDASLLAQPQLAVVGSRNPTAAGRETAQAFAAHLARCGLVITSGLALGIDAAAHEGALAAGGATIAVCATGLDRVYPAAHRPLAERIAAQGALVSEYPPGTPPRAEHFPRRNRIISGLTLGTLVVEAALRSGSLITARLAAEQGREVFAIPGSIHNPLARGCHRLIREGAKLVESAQDILEELAPQLGACLTAAPPSAPAPRTPDTLDPDYRRLLDALGFAPASVDALVERTGFSADVVSSMLLLLELTGKVASAPGGRYVRLPSEGK